MCPRSALSLRLLTGGHTYGEISGMSTWNAEGFPLSRFGESKMLGKKQNLADVMGVMRNLPIDGLHHGVWFRANRNGSRKVGLGQRFERVENVFPAALPHFG